MVSFGEIVSEKVREAACFVVSSADSAASFVGEKITGDETANVEIVRGLRRSVCNNSNDTVNLPPGEFTGGQCPKLYNGTYTTRFVRSSGQVDNPVNRAYSGIRGPLRSAPYFTLNGPGFRVQIDHTDSQGNPTTTVLVSSGSNNPNYVSMQLSNYSIVTADGSPDDCGNPPGPPIPPYVPTPVNVNIEYEDNSQTTINEDVDITVFAPIIGIGGVIFAPVTVAGNTFKLEGTVELSPNFEVNLRPEINIKPGGDVDSPPPEPPESVGEPSDAPDGRVIVGCLVTVTDIQGIRATRIAQGQNPDIFAPRLGNVSFYVNTTAGTGWTTDIPVKNVRQWIDCPTPFGAIDVKGSPESSYDLVVTPVWGYPLQPRV